MCGIAGFDLGRNDERTAAILAQRLAQRGPDGSWFATAGPYGFVQTRLAVVDLSDRVRYPLRNETGELSLLFNGEIYAHGDLRADLERRGHRFATRCDAEVVVHGFEEWGEDLFRRLDGMFALALFDQRTNELLLARDALGIKPLVYSVGHRFGFCSDALSLVASGVAAGAIDETLIPEFFAFHYLLPPHTGLEDVFQLRPGEMLRRRANGAVTTQRWRRPAFTAARPVGKVGTERAARALDRSVRRQLAADVPVGVFLSSGLDSALVLDSAVRAGAKPIAFTLGFHGHGDYDELPAAARLTRDLGIEHETCELSGGFEESVSLVAGAFDQPFADSSAIATAELSRLARKRVTVVLSGTGGDDLFGGYYRHRLHLISAAVERVPSRARHLLSEMPRTRGAERRSALALMRSYAARLAEIPASDSLTQYFQLVTAASSPSVQAALTAADAPLDVADILQMVELPDAPTLQQIQAFELQSYLPGDLLAKEDRTSMAVGLETRVPLLGSEMLGLAEEAADDEKIGLFGGKRLLRRVARHRLPTYLTRARKRGFAVPLADLFAGPWRQEAMDWFASSGSSIVDGEAAAQMLRGGTVPPTDSWALAVLVGWEKAVGEARGQAAATSGRPTPPGSWTA